ncbi:MAG TPA: MlaD family protein [Candidatus Omnitrophota bacterium]|nr:MlaD family protein [Candidatus Omnitrophota bacterium]HPS37592.1 MlaD family protein [Candidatus Omnitrophota bacterium]
MSEKTRYFKIGLFTLASLAFLCAGLLLFGAGSFLEKPPVLVETYFEQSVQGLDVGAQVKLNGVKIGKVREIVFLKDKYGKDQSPETMAANYRMVGVVFEVETKYFPRLKDKSREEAQALLDFMVAKHTFRAKMVGIGITGLVYLELGFSDPAEVPPPMKFPWKPENLYIPSAPSVASRFNDAVDKLLNKMDSDIYPMIANLNRASAELPSVVAKLDQTLPRLQTIAKNVEDITSTGKKYPSQMIFGEAPPKSRFDR